MIVATFLLCLLGTASACCGRPFILLRLNNEGVDDSNGNESGAVQFPKCEACVQSLSKHRHWIVRNGNLFAKNLVQLKFTARSRTPWFWSLFINKTDDHKLMGFITEHLDKSQALCGLTRTKDNLTCTREPKGGRALMQFFVDRIMKEFQVSSREVCEKCKTNTMELHTLLSGFITDHMDRVLTLCDVSRIKDNLTCPRDPTYQYGRSILQVLVDRITKDFQISNRNVCEKCKTDVEDLWALLQSRDAQNELKEYTEAACKAVWNYWSGAGSDADWCKEGIDRIWDNVIQILRSALADSDHLCSAMGFLCRTHVHDFIHVATPYLNGVIRRLYSHSVDGFNTRCTTCIIWINRFDRDFDKSVEGGFIRDVKNSVAHLLCNLWIDDEIDSCLTQVNSQFEMNMRFFRKFFSLCYTEQYGPRICTNEDDAKIAEELTTFHVYTLPCEWCKNALSTLKEELKNEELGKELDRIAGRLIFGKSFEGTSGLLAKLAEYINAEDQCWTTPLCWTPSGGWTSSHKQIPTTTTTSAGDATW